MRTKIVTQALRLWEGGISLKNIKKVMPILFSNHNKVNIKMIVEKSIEMYCSLGRSVDEAGGAGWSIETLSEMTVMDLISILGTNNVRFVYTMSNKDKCIAKQKLKEIKSFANEISPNQEDDIPF